MKIQFLQDTHIRISPDTSADPVGVISKGAEIEVFSQEVLGKNVNGNNRWYQDSGGKWYYWSGETRVIEGQPADPPPPSPPPPPTSTWPDYPDYPIFDEIFAMLEEGEIPEGETRRVPPFETLQMIEAGFQDTITTASNARLEETEVPVEETEEPKEEETPAVILGAAAPHAEVRVEEPQEEQKREVVLEGPIEAERLNWGIRKYKMEQDWWKTQKLTGKGVKIALLSTGVNPGHPDLRNASDWSLYEGAAQTDEQGLGNQAAVVCAGTGHTVYGVAPGAELLIGKIGAQDHLIRPEALIAGLEWAIEAEADIIGMLVDLSNLGSEKHTMEGLIKRAQEKDIFLLAPVGNSENNIPESRSPADLDGVFSVGAHTETGERCSFSAKSYYLDLLAPGEGLLTSGSDMEVGMNTKSVAIATAFTAGFAALVHQWLQRNGKAGRAAFIESLLKKTAASRQNLNMVKNVEFGYGLLNPAAVLKKLSTSAQE